jgi:hypothetical protein
MSNSSGSLIMIIGRKNMGLCQFYKNHIPMRSVYNIKCKTLILSDAGIEFSEARTSTLKMVQI